MMIQTIRGLFFAAGLSSCFLLTTLADAETWTDSTGKFRIEAEFVKVEGKSIVLRKADGTTATVPIERLSPESRAQAKRLYELAKSGGGAPASPPSEPESPSSEPAPSGVAQASANMPIVAPTTPSPLNFKPPSPPAVAPMPAFPEDASLQETVDFVRTQVMAGHPEVFWYALPDEMRDTLDSEEMRNVFVSALKEQAQMNAQTEPVLMKAIEVLITKKEFLLKSPLMAQLPPAFLPTIQQGYDPAVGVIYEIAALSFGSDALEKMTITQLVDHHGPRIGAHLSALAKLAPPETVDGFLSKVVVDQTSETTGTITAPENTGAAETKEMVKYLGRWIPKDLADLWETKKESLVAELQAQVDAARANPQAAQQAQMMVAGFIPVANGILDPMLAATTQEEFDQSVMQVVGMLGMMGGGPGGPAGPGGPGGFGAPGAPGEPGAAEAPGEPAPETAPETGAFE